jgi:hypothetical protein
MNSLLPWRWLALACLLTMSACAAGQPNPAQAQAKPGGRAVKPAATTSETRTRPPAWPRFKLEAERTWLLDPPKGKRFDASGLLLTRSGQLLTVSDRGPDLYEIRFTEGRLSADLIRFANCFTVDQLRPFAAAKTSGQYDCEGIAQDEAGRIYICEESDRWILRWDPSTGTVDRLAIDWAPVRRYFSPSESNASLEGIAVAKGKLYVANERELGRIIVVDLARLEVIDHFLVRPSNRPEGDVQYSDLSWFDESLWVLCRKSQVVLEVNPATHQALAEFDYRDMENAPSAHYLTLIHFGLMEGLAVDEHGIWLVTDNNGLPHSANLEDTRPTLFRCPWPDRKRPLNF